MRVYQPLLNFLDRLGYGAIMLGRDNRVMLSNTRAASLVQELASESQPAIGDDFRICPALRRPCESLRVDEKWMALPRFDLSKRPVVVHVAPTADPSEMGPAKIVVMVDLEGYPAINPCVLQELFGLTSAESRVAIAIASGRGPRQIANMTGVSAATIRKQLAAVFAKTQTRRQSELNLLVNRLSILP